jgi:UDP-arabinose 4-epimerase
MVEQALQDASAAYGLKSVSLRYFNASGAHPSGEIGELHEPEPHLIPRALMAANGETEDIDIFGADYPTPDGTAIRDYIHVCDLADAHVVALRYLEDGGQTISLNLGTGRGHSVREILDAVTRVTGREPPARVAARRPGDPPMLVADPAAARRVLRFAPKWTEIDAVISSAWDWHRQCAFQSRT